MHSVIYRTQLLRDCGLELPKHTFYLELPKHTFYVDNIFVYQPLPWVKNMYYLDVDLYRYFIGRADQSVNEKVMVTRVDQQLRVTYQMIDSHDLRKVAAEHKKLARYMFNYLAMMMAISSRQHPRGPGQKDPAVGVSAHGGRGDLSQDEVPGGVRFHQLPRLPGAEAVGAPLPAGAENLQIQLVDQSACGSRCGCFFTKS